MEHQDIPEATTWFKAIGLVSLYVASYAMHNYNAIMGNIFITLSVVFLIWKMWKEYKKDKKNGHAENN